MQAANLSALHRVVKSPIAKDVKQAPRRRRQSYDMMFVDQATASLPRSAVGKLATLQTSELKPLLCMHVHQALT